MNLMLMLLLISLNDANVAIIRSNNMILHVVFQINMVCLGFLFFFTKIKGHNFNLYLKNFSSWKFFFLML